MMDWMTAGYVFFSAAVMWTLAWFVYVLVAAEIDRDYDLFVEKMQTLREPTE